MSKRIFWTPVEFDKIAASVMTRYPQKHYEAARMIDDIDLSIREMMESARLVLPPDRYRKVHNITPMKMGLLGAFARARGEAAPVDAAANAHPVRWTLEEWRFVAEALHRLFPGAGYPYSANLETLRLSHLNAAAATLPISRRRSFVALAGPRNKLLEVYRNDDARPAPAQVPVARPPLAVASEKDRDSRGRRTKVYWTDAEWRLIAAELQLRFPSLAHPTAPEALLRLHAKDFEFAQQRVLPQHRRRACLTNIKAIRQVLAQVLPTVAQFEAMSAEKPSLPDATEVIEAAAVAPAPVTPVENAWELAVRPLAGLLAKELVAALMPELLAQLQPLFAQRQIHVQPEPGQQQQPAAAAPDQQQQPAPVESAPARAYPFLKPQQQAKPKPTIYVPPPDQNVARKQPKVEMPKIGIVGPLPIQQRTLEAAFPNVKLLFVEKSNDGKFVVEKLASCQRVIGMIGFMSHSGDGALRRHFGDRYTRVTGSVSNIKSQIEAWLRAGIIHQSVAQGRYEPVA